MAATPQRAVDVLLYPRNQYIQERSRQQKRVFVSRRERWRPFGIASDEASGERGARAHTSAEARARTSECGRRGADLGARTSEREARSGHWRGGVARSRRRSLASAEALRERGARAFTGAEARERGARAHTSAKRDPPAASAKRERTLARRRCAHERGATVVVSLDHREHAESTQSSGSAYWRARSSRTQSHTVPHCPTCHTLPPHVWLGLLGAY